MLRCPNCNHEVYLSVLADETGETISSMYHCSFCKIELTESEIIEKTKNEDMEEYDENFIS